MNGKDPQQIGTFDLANTDQARGWIDVFTNKAGSVYVKGWILHPTRPLDSATVTVNGLTLGTFPLVPYAGVAGAFPSIAHAERSGIEVRLDGGVPEQDSYLIQVDGHYAGTPRASFQWHIASLPADQPVPPPHLRQRVAGSDSLEVFAQGFQSSMNLLKAVAPHRALASIGSLLDWGCGSGRCTSHLLRLLPKASISGCDIDHEAVAWAKSNLTRGTFLGSGPFPPLPFAEESFDVVLGASVMTHLKRDVQPLWLKEIRRVLKPNGIFVASVHGPFAAHFLGFLPQLEKERMIDGINDGALEGIAPAGYYRAVFQTPDYTLETWSDDFEILDYISGGLMCHQDLVVMRRK